MRRLPLMVVAVVIIVVTTFSAFPTPQVTHANTTPQQAVEAALAPLQKVINSDEFYALVGLVVQAHDYLTCGQDLGDYGLALLGDPGPNLPGSIIDDCAGALADIYDLLQSALQYPLVPLAYAPTNNSPYPPPPTSSPPPSSTPSSATPVPTSCISGVNQGVTLFVDANYGGNCHAFGVGEYSDLSQFGLDQNVSSLQDSNGAYHITFYDQKGLVGTPGYFDSDTSQLMGYWNDRARSMRVEMNGTTSSTPCPSSGVGVTLFVGANYGGNCHAFGVGEYSDLSQFGLDQNVSSLQDSNGAYHITFYDQKGLVGTPGYFDSDTSQLPGYWNDRARSMRIEKHRPTSCSIDTDGIAAYLNNDYQNGCIFITGDIPDLTSLNFDHVIASIRFVGSYIYNKHIAIYRQTNYQDLCGIYWLDQSDLRGCADVALSIKVLSFVRPPQAQNLASSAILDHSGSNNAVDDNLSTEWVGGHSVPLGFVFPSPVTIQDIVVFDRAQSSTDNNQINKLQLVFSDGTVINDIDMTSGGPRCADVSFPAKQVSWVNVVPTDASGNNGFKEIQLWDTTGNVYSQNNCVMKFTKTPTQGSGSSPLVPVPSPSPSPTSTGNATVFEDFNNGIGSWWTNGNVAAAQDNGNGIIRFTPAAQSSAEASKNVGTTALNSYDTITLRINLHGATLLGNDASALYLDQGGGWKYVSLSNYVQQGMDGWQYVMVPLSDFQGFNKTASFDRFGFRFWVPTASTVDVDDITFSSSTGSSTPTPTPTISPSPSPTPLPLPSPAPLPSPTPTSGVELLSAPWHLTGNNGAAELYQSIDPNVLQGMNTIRITYNLHGLQALGGDASAIIFDQSGWQYISLSDYGQNGLDGQQTVDIPLSDFSGLNLSQTLDGTIHVRFWFGSAFTVDITSIEVYTK